MHWLYLMAIAATCAAGQNYDLDARAISFSGKAASLGPLYAAGLSVGQGFRDNSYENNIVTPTPSPSSILKGSNNQQQQLYRKPNGAVAIDASRGYEQQPAIRVSSGPRNGPARGGQQPLPYGQTPSPEELEEEKEEPDRLTLLLPQSKFDCVNKQTGYYADEDLNCEVFHYCHENAKHSWICPEGFTFHQVHLICMPPSGDITCKKSSQYHFVNEYLYKPLNLAEAENKPNVTLRYSERYYPADIYTDEREAGDYQITSSPGSSLRRPAQQVYPSSQPSTANNIPASSRQQPTGLPQFRLPVNQVFRSPEEVNIPLQQRRPQAQQHQALRRYPQVRPGEEEYD